ncbi:MAG: hypothetical protein AAF563_18245 [Pseudomonadota bacterium]
MNLSRRVVLLGTASAAVMTSAIAGIKAEAAMQVGSDAESKTVLLRMVRVMYPHDKFSDAPYLRTCDAVIGAANGSVGQALMFSDGIQDLKASGFTDMDDAAALAHLTSIEGTPFFQLVRGNAVVALYNDGEVWEALGYEGASFDKGGYINRGFNDLDWLPEPRITEA